MKYDEVIYKSIFSLKAFEFLFSFLASLLTLSNFRLIRRTTGRILHWSRLIGGICFRVQRALRVRIFGRSKSCVLLKIGASEGLCKIQNIPYFGFDTSPCWIESPIRLIDPLNRVLEVVFSARN